MNVVARSLGTDEPGLKIITPSQPMHRMMMLGKQVRRLLIELAEPYVDPAMTSRMFHRSKEDTPMSSFGRLLRASAP